MVAHTTLLEISCRGSNVDGELKEKYAYKNLFQPFSYSTVRFQDGRCLEINIFSIQFHACTDEIYMYIKIKSDIKN